MVTWRTTKIVRYLLFYPNDIRILEDPYSVLLWSCVYCSTLEWSLYFGVITVRWSDHCTLEWSLYAGVVTVHWSGHCTLAGC